MKTGALVGGATPGVSASPSWEGGGLTDNGCGCGGRACDAREIGRWGHSSCTTAADFDGGKAFDAVCVA